LNFLYKSILPLLCKLKMSREQSYEDPHTEEEEDLVSAEPSEGEAQQSEGEEVDRRRGRVKWFDARKAFGFVVDIDDKREYFVHLSAIRVERPVFRTLFENEMVEFRVEPDDSGRDCAVSVTGPDRSQLICESYELSQVYHRGFRRGLAEADRDRYDYRDRDRYRDRERSSDRRRRRDRRRDSRRRN
jgi:CspA family cold shock protein